MKKNKEIDAFKSKKAEDDEIEALFETFDKQFKDIEDKFQNLDKEMHVEKEEEESEQENP